MCAVLTTTIEFQSGLQGDSFFGGGNFLVCLGRSVKGVDVSLVVLRVVEPHDLLRDVGLESIVLVRQGWQSEGHFCWWWMEENGVHGGQPVYKKYPLGFLI